jgi:DNA polymerase
MGQLSFFAPPPEEETLEQTRQDCLRCERCRLSQTRDQVVFGAGDPEANLMLIGQGPSQSDNGTGLPYSGPSGDVLDKALAEVGLSRDKIWLTNIHKCLAYDAKNRKIRPPRADEIKACQSWLAAEIRLVKPRVIVCVGGPAAKVIIGPQFKLNEQRGDWQPNKLAPGVKTLATLQPAYLMRLKEWNREEALAGWQALVADLFKAVEASKEKG